MHGRTGTRDTGSVLPLALGMSVPASPMPASKPGPSDDGSFATVAETARAIPAAGLWSCKEFNMQSS